jgi:preprotein translocase subunit SecA
MVFNFLSKLLDYNLREIKKLQAIVDQINALEDKTRDLKDSEFKKETEKIKKAIADGQTLDSQLTWAFALAREASRRVLGMRQFDEQLMAGIVLHQGKIAEQKTGEGKTLSAVAPLYLNSLTGKGAHLVTVNDYLARRDMGWMGAIYTFLGVSVSSIIGEKSLIYDPKYIDPHATDGRMIHLKEITRGQAYKADITYGINSEFGFDYLRDNMVYRKEDLSQRDFNYAVIDEVDSVLIDEARTPHIISAPYEEDTSKYYQYATMVRSLEDKTDYVIDEKAKTAHLTDQGISKIEKSMGVDNIYEKDFDTLFHVEAALKARTLFKNDKDYIVSGDEVVIVDEFTGRLLPGRRFSEGLHQAIEAKENVSIKKESRTLATVSLQNYFRMYKKLSGMTGTAATEAEEFNKIYKLEVIILPTHQKMVRQDLPDFIYKTEKGKFSALVEAIAEQHKIGRPVLVGTTSIDKNEILSQFLKDKGIPHKLLNAKNHEQEAQIISNAGLKGAVTVATNMAGRGVDIVLGGEPPDKYQIKEGDNTYEAQMNAWRKSHDQVVELGGLAVYGTERHESRRIDNQLRGRAGRQGDPGETRFFVSLEDDMIRIFGGEQVSKLMNFFKIPEDQPLEHAMVSRALEQAQVKVEGYNFDIRKHLVDFDDVINKQRSIVYDLRRKFLSHDTPEKVKEVIDKLFDEEILNIINTSFFSETEPNYEALAQEFSTILPIDPNHLLAHIKGKGQDEVTKLLQLNLEKAFETKEKEIGKELYYEALKSIYLSTIDKYWTEHLTTIDDLREGINLRGYAQLDPLVEYKNSAFNLFEKLLQTIDYEVSRRILKIELAQAPEEQSLLEQSNVTYSAAANIDVLNNTKLQEGSSEPAKQPKKNTAHVNKKKLGRNDPCWCGSGKKYKKCHYPN